MLRAGGEYRDSGHRGKAQVSSARFRTSISEDGNDRNRRDLKNTQLQPYSSYMNTLPHFTAFIASLPLVLSPQAFGLASDYGLGESISHPDTWPPRLVDLAKLPSRVAGYFINQDDYFAFTGDTAGFRACLDTCTGLAEFAPTTLHIHKGKGTFQPLDKVKKPLPCDWQLDVINQHWRAAKPNPTGPKYSLELHVWLDGAVDVTAIKLPPSMKTIKE